MSDNKLIFIDYRSETVFYEKREEERKYQIQTTKKALSSKKTRKIIKLSVN